MPQPDKYDIVTTAAPAHEVDQKEIDQIFRSLPWAERICLLDNTIITRKEWKIDVAARAVAAEEAKEKAAAT
jgi:hypothetical protein